MTVRHPIPHGRVPSLVPSVTILLATIVLVSAGLIGCATGGAPDGPNGDSTGSIQGVVYAPNGQTPIAGARVWVPDDASMAQQGAIAETVSDTRGRFVLRDLPAGTVPVSIAKGDWSKSFTATVVAGQVTNVPAADTTLPATGEGSIRIAVCMGSYDRMEDVLAKLGFGEVDEWGVLVPGTQTFDLYDYGEAAGLLGSREQMANYDLIFLNCGVDENPLWMDREATVANMRAYVEGGGRLYATDLAYDYVEQAFPDAIDFYGSDDTPSDEAEAMGEAEVGRPDITVDATVLDDNLRGWLAGRGALQPDGSVHISGFASGWAVMEAVGSGTNNWIEGPVTYGYLDPVTAVRPLTVTFEAGNGRVLYTSYHTAEEAYEGLTPTELLPQEQVLAYLAFELF